MADSSSKSPLFSLDIRVNMVEKSVAQISNVNVVSFNSLLVDLCSELGVDVFG